MGDEGDVQKWVEDRKGLFDYFSWPKGSKWKRTRISFRWSCPGGAILSHLDSHCTIACSERYLWDGETLHRGCWLHCSHEGVMAKMTWGWIVSATMDGYGEWEIGEGLLKVVGTHMWTARWHFLLKNPIESHLVTALNGCKSASISNFFTARNQRTDRTR